jgi:dihydroxy-acid dehydratase
MLNGWYKGERAGSGTIKWAAKKMKSAGEIGWPNISSWSPPPRPRRLLQHDGHGLDDELAGRGARHDAARLRRHPAAAQGARPDRYYTGRRAVELVHEDLKPSQIMTREAFENAIVVNSAIGGSTNAPIHLNGIAKHLGIELTNDDWERIGHAVPLLVDMQPAGRFLGEDYHRAGGVPPWCRADRRRPAAASRARYGQRPHDGRELRGPLRRRPRGDPHLRQADPERGGFLNLKGNLFDSAIMKTSVISRSSATAIFPTRSDPDAFEGKAVVFDGREDYHARINDPATGIDANSILIIRGAGPVGYPAGAEVVNMQPPDALLKQGINELPCIGDGRQSGTSGSPSILNAAPEAAVGGGLALVQTGDRIRIDLNKRRADILIGDDELAPAAAS